MSKVKKFVNDKLSKKSPKKAFVRKYKLSKSVDFHNVKVSVDSMDQLLAETTASKQLINKIQDAMFQENNVAKVQLTKGTLTLSKKDEGLYDGFFQDSMGQVVEKFDNMTAAIIAKNLEMKNLEPVANPSQPALAHSPQEEAEDRVIAQQEAVKIVDAAHQRIDMVHNRIDQLEKESAPKKLHLRIRMGDFEVELRQSVKAFVQDFKKSQDLDDDIDEKIISKAVHSWYKQNQERIGVSSFAAGVKELYDNWETHKEGFYQTVYALEQVQDSNE